MTQLRGAIWGQGRSDQGPIVGETNLELSDLRGADFTTPLTDNELKDLLAALLAMLGEKPKSNQYAAARLRLGRTSTPGQSSGQFVFTASAERPVLVSDPKNPVFADIPTDWLITIPTPAYTTALVALLADQLAAGSSDVANGIAERALIGAAEQETRSLSVRLACQLLANIWTGKVKLERATEHRVSDELLRQRIDCATAKP